DFPSRVVPTMPGAGCPFASSSPPFSLGPGDPETGGSDRASCTRATVARIATASPIRTYRRERSIRGAVADLLDGECPRHRGNRMHRAAELVGARLQRVVLVGLRGATVDRRLVLEELRA